MDWADRYWMTLYDEPYNEELRRMVESGEPDADLAEAQEYGEPTWTAE